MNLSNMQTPMSPVGIPNVTHTSEDSKLTSTEESKHAMFAFLCLGSLTQNSWGNITLLSLSDSE